MARIIEITDLSVPELGPYVRLTEAQIRAKRDPEAAMFIAERSLNMGWMPVIHRYPC